MEDVAVEVRCENGAYYKAYITEIHRDEVSVAFENDWQPESKFPYNRVRLPPVAPNDKMTASTIEGQEVEVFSRANEQEACGWWAALVKMTKGNYHVVEYLGWETTYTEIVSSDRLRLKNTNQPITKGTFHQFEIPVPEDVQEYSKLESAHKEFKKAIKAALCKYNPDKKCLQIIFFSSQGRHEGLKKRALMLSDMHFRSLRQKGLLLEVLDLKKEVAMQLKCEDLSKSVMLSAEDAGNCFTVTWTVENYSVLLGPADIGLRSPTWRTDTTEESAWWVLNADTSDSNLIVFHLKQLVGNTVLDRYEMSLTSTSCDEVPLNSMSPSYGLRHISFSMERNTLLGGDNGQSLFPNDTLTLCCKMWKKTMKAGEHRHHSAMHSVNYIWNSENSGSSELLDFVFDEKSNLTLYVVEEQRKDKSDTRTITVGSVPRGGSYVSIVDCNLSIVDGLGHVINEKCIYPHTSWRCDIENLAEENPGSGFQFQLECVVQVHNFLDSSGTLNNDLLKIYKEKTLSDAILTTEEQSFSAHRSILAARSPVFAAMFQKEQMSECREGVVAIEDVDSATLGRMLVFLYSDSLEKMNCEEASALYYAADKYAVPNLKKKCADVLKAGLAADNVCQTLVLAEIHSDQELIKCTFDFIRNHQEVISSAEWEKLEEINPKIALKCFREVFVTK